MAVTRKNILNDSSVRDKFIQGVKLLKAEDSGKTTADFGIAGDPTPVSTYDLFVIWHHRAMMQLTPAPPLPNPTGRNAAHRGSVFLPWHRVMLLMLERNLQRVLNDDSFGLPYWDWGATGDLDPDQQKQAAIWGADCLGGDGNPVQSGPFAFNPDDPASWRVRVEGNSAGELVGTDRGLWRVFASSDDGVPDLPTTQQATDAVGLTPYDVAQWDVASSDGMRNLLEGWRSPRSEPEHHNRVHVWVGGDMWPSTSPNDPVFYLNHCNVDRLWETWMQQNGRQYLPDMTASDDLMGHRIDDPLASPPGASATPREVLDISENYTYDVLG
ncbi:MAG TPA: tyrosinase family protein [Blastocatellia bacterium]|nr:tyrosinase family protein [Blastocatellia bacterium]